MGRGGGPGAPKGNQFWKLRAKHGRDLLFFDAELLREAAYEYFAWCDENPLYTAEQTSGKGKPIIIPAKDEDDDDTIIMPEPLTYIPEKRPYTRVGFCHYVKCSESWLWAFKEAAKRRNEKDILDVIDEILNIIDRDQQEGSLRGHYNANLTARLQGIADTSKQEVKAEITDKTPDPMDNLTFEQLYELKYGRKPNTGD